MSEVTLPDPDDVRLVLRPDGSYALLVTAEVGKPAARPVIGALLVLDNGDGTFGMVAAGSIKIEPMTAPAGSS